MHMLDAAFVQDAIETCHHLWQVGWGENHAGNLTYLLSEEEEAICPRLAEPLRYIPAAHRAEKLSGRCFLVTRAGAFFRNIKNRPARDLGIVRVGGDGESLELLWGFEGGGLPTSELPSHLLCHGSRREADPRNRVVLHCHPTYTVAMTLKEEFDEISFTRVLWRLNSECILVFPEGIGLLPWMVCGNGAIGSATAEKMKEFRVVVWPCHGVFACGNSLSETVGLIETVEKNALVYMVNNGDVHRGIRTSQLKELADAFGLTPRPGIL